MTSEMVEELIKEHLRIDIETNCARYGCDGSIEISLIFKDSIINAVNISGNTIESILADKTYR